MKYIVTKTETVTNFQILDWQHVDGFLESLRGFEERVTKYWKQHNPDEQDSIEIYFNIMDCREVFINKVYEFFLPINFTAKDIKEDEWKLLQGSYEKFLKRYGYIDDAIIIAVDSYDLSLLKYIEEELNAIIYNK